jgi:hypothetical protein
MPLACGNFWPYRRAKPPGLQANSSAAKRRSVRITCDYNGCLRQPT